MGGQGLYLRSFDHLGRSSEDKYCKKTKKGKCDGLTDGQTDGPTKRGVESRSTRLKTLVFIVSLDPLLLNFLHSKENFVKINDF